MNNMEQILNEYLAKHYPARILFEKLTSLGDVYLIGGVLREIKDNGKIVYLRDIDIVLDTDRKKEYERFLENYSPERNRFGGYKIQCQDLIVDIWLLNQTWAYSTKAIKCQKKDYPSKLPQTVFLNMDSIVYDFKKNIWYDDEYQKAMDTRILDIVLEENPFLELNIVRSFVLRKRYEMTFSERLKDVIKDYIQKCESKKCDATYKLYETQNIRYKKEILSKNEFAETIKKIMYE